jgi:hypothetical protein
MKRSNHVKPTQTTDTTPTTEQPSRLNIEVPLDEVVGGQVSSCNVCQCRCKVCVCKA